MIVENHLLLIQRSLCVCTWFSFSVICLLICNFLIISIDLPITLSQIYFGRLHPSSPSFCLFWIFVSYFLFPSSSWIMAVVCVQRYLLIFHRHLMNNRFVHYAPLLFVPVIFSIWYFVLVIFYPCEQQFDYTELWCNGACYLSFVVIGTIDWIFSSWISVLITIICNILLIVRVVYQKLKISRARTWQTTRKLVIQLSSISFLFVSIYLPVIIFGSIRVWKDPNFLFALTIVYLVYVSYLVPLLLPFVALLSLPEIVRRIKHRLSCFGNQVQPIHPEQFVWITASRRFHVPHRSN
jgi:hypothetical protein